jgi:formylglycine-generating enzyme required for sulfatase activity
MVSEQLMRAENALEKAQRRVDRFLQRYDGQEIQEKVFQFLQYASFPLTLTAELCFLLREEFTQDLPWYVATDVLLSSLCDSVGYDLYEIETATQNYLRSQLGEADLKIIAQFLGRYISYRLTQENNQRARELGDPAQWIALACLKSAAEVTQEIKKQLAQILKATEDPGERFRLVSMIENLGDLLAQRGYEPFDLRDLQARLEEGRSIDERDELKEILRDAGFPELKTLDIEFATVVFDEDASAQVEGELTPFTFETVTLDRRGEEIQREKHTAYSFIETLPEDIALEMIAIPSGRFKMGSPEQEHQRYEDEGPVHDVTVQPFYLGKYPITQAQWRIVANLPQEQRSLDLNPAYFKGNNRPVEQVSWLDATEFCLRLSKASGRTYRLPSEAEWEYACRARTETPFHFGETITAQFANYDSSRAYRQEKSYKIRGETTSVSQFIPNSFGLYDMHGSVWEWCQDNWHDNYEGAPDNGSAWISKNKNDNHVIRGGSWYYIPRLCRSACRYSNTPVNRNNRIGFRVVCETPRTL